MWGSGPLVDRGGSGIGAQAFCLDPCLDLEGQGAISLWPRALGEGVKGALLSWWGRGRPWVQRPQRWVRGARGDLSWVPDPLG